MRRRAFQKGLFDDKGHTAMDVNTRLDLEWVEGDQFFRCPHCSAKNVVVDTTGPNALPGLRIVHIKE